MSIAFGPWSTTLAIGAGFGLAVAGLLAATRSNTVANRLLALLQLTFEAGLSSKSSFNRCFEARTGLTPSQYREAALTAGARS